MYLAKYNSGWDVSDSVFPKPPHFEALRCIWTNQHSSFNPQDTRHPARQPAFARWRNLVESALLRTINWWCGSICNGSYCVYIRHQHMINARTSPYKNIRCFSQFGTSDQYLSTYRLIHNHDYCRHFVSLSTIRAYGLHYTTDYPGLHENQSIKAQLLRLLHTALILSRMLLLIPIQPTENAMLQVRQALFHTIALTIILNCWYILSWDTEPISIICPSRKAPRRPNST